MTISQRPWYLVFALLPLLALALAACGGDDDGDEAFELPPPGEYSFEVTGTMEIEFLEEAVSAAPLALGAPRTVDYEGSFRIKLGEGRSFTISKGGVVWVAGKEVEGAEGGAFPIKFTQNEEMESSGTISEDGMKIELNVVAELSTGETTTHQQPFLLEGAGDPFSDEGATLAPPNAEPVIFNPDPEEFASQEFPALNIVIAAMFIHELFGGEEFEGTDGQGQDGADEEPPPEPSPSPTGAAGFPPLEINVEAIFSGDTGCGFPGFTDTLQITVDTVGTITITQPSTGDSNSGPIDADGNFDAGQEDPPESYKGKLNPDGSGTATNAYTDTTRNCTTNFQVAWEKKE